MAFLVRLGVGQTVQFSLPSDTALTILTNRNGVVDLQVSGTGGVMAYSITLFMDRSRVDVLAADTAPGGYGLPVPSVAASGDSVRLTASGAGSTTFTVTIARLTFHLDTLAQQGSLVSMRVNALTRGDGSDGLALHRTGILNVCQARTYAGDVTGDRVVNSRDALVILTAAVGLPVGNFDLTPGDVDLDQQVTSRDALFTLAYGIGVSVGTSIVGRPLPLACAPLAPAPDSLLFFRSGTLYGVGAGDTLPSPLALVLAPYTSFRPRWSPDGTRIVYTGYTASYGYEVVAANASGTSVDTLTRNTAFDAGPDWAPDGTRLAFVSDRTSPPSVFLMDANGASQVQLTANLTVNTSQPVSWSPDGTRIAFSAYQGCCTYGLWVINPDGSGLTEVVPGSAGQSVGSSDWSAGSDSIYYYRGSTNYIQIAPVVAGDTGRVAIRLPSYGYYPTASRAGVGFWSSVHSPYDFFLRRASDGRYLRLVRGVAANNDAYFAFRRSGVPYVSSVTVAPKPGATIIVSVSNTLQLTASVLNSDNNPNTTVPITWTSRNTGIVTVDGTGLATAVATGSAYVVVSARGWRSDSTLVTVQP
jgi:hypothetical protein